MASSTSTLLLLVTTLAVLSSCGGSSNSPNDDTNGPCVHNYYEPVLNIDRVITNPANTEIDQISLIEVVHDDSEVKLEEWCALQAEELCYGLSFEGEMAACSPPCGFGNEEGEWRIEVSAEGYQSTTAILNVSYEVFEGGCPSYNDEGAHFELEIDEN